MPIYLKFTQKGLPVLKGDATAKDHEGWIELYSFQWGASRHVAGFGEGVKAKSPAITEAVVTKEPDSASRELFTATLGGRFSDGLKAQVDFVKNDPQGPSVYQTFVLENVLVANYFIGGGQGGAAGPHESITLSFTKVAFSRGATPATVVTPSLPAFSPPGHP